MKILYVSGLTIGLKDIFKGETEISGHPAFYYTIKKLIEKNHHIDFIIFTDQLVNLQIDKKHFPNVKIKKIVYTKFSSKFNILKLFHFILRNVLLTINFIKILYTEKYDFVYITDRTLFNIALITKILKIPSGIRLYGCLYFLNSIKYKNRLLIKIKNLPEFLTFKIGANFILASDDATKCDKIQKMFKKNKKYNFFHWKTGIDLNQVGELTQNFKNEIKVNYIFFASRFASWKRQDRILTILKKLNEKNTNIHLLMSGEKSDLNYFNFVMNKIQQLQLEHYVKYLGLISQKEVRFLAKNALANLLFYDESCLGNVFYEIMAEGSLIIGLEKRGLEQFIENGYNGFLVKDEDEAVKIILDILEGKINSTAIKQNARKTALKRFLSIDERFDKEVELIERTARREKNIKIELSIK